ncbi:MAG: hypothetical protein ACMUIM_11910 [bacterium]
MRTLKVFALNRNRRFLLILSLLSLIIIFTSFPVSSQFQNPFLFPAIYGLPLPGVPFPSTSGALAQNISSIVIGREFPAGQVNLENISFYIRTTSSIYIVLDIVSENNQLFFIEVIPEDGEVTYPGQGNQATIPVGTDRLDGQWHEWEINALDELIAEFGASFAFISKVEIRGEAFCLGPIATFSENDEGIMETTYLASFTTEKDNIRDYGWSSPTSVTLEYYDSIEGDTEAIEEGYVCLSPGQITQQIQVPKIPVTFITPSLGPGPFLPVTTFESASSLRNFPLRYSPLMPPSRIASQFYSTPINPVLGRGLLQSIPLYMDAQTGTPYSVNQNLFQNYDPFPTYPTNIDYSSDPAYAYLLLNNTLNSPTLESTGAFIPVPYYF